MEKIKQNKEKVKQAKKEQLGSSLRYASQVGFFLKPKLKGTDSIKSITSSSSRQVSSVKSEFYASADP